MMRNTNTSRKSPQNPVKPRRARVPKDAGRLAPEKSSVSPVLLEMLERLKGWTPKSNDNVRAVARKLLLAVDSAETKDADGSCNRVLSEALATCQRLVGHTLTCKNGVSLDFDFVVCYNYYHGEIVLDTVHMFKRNRIGEYAMSIRKLKLSPSSILCTSADSECPGRRPCPIPGMSLDTKDAENAFNTEAPILLNALNSLPLPIGKKPASSKRRKETK